MLKLSKHCSVAGQKGSKPDANELELINEYALIELNEENVYVRKVYLAHNFIDRDGDVFDDSLLDDFARTLPGKGLFNKHPRGWDGDSGPGIGRWYFANVLDLSIDEARKLLRSPKLRAAPGAERGKILEACFYLARTDSNKKLIEDIDYGVANDVSIGFIASDRSPITDVETDQRIAWRLLGPGEALEGSLVWLGAQPGARVHKQASLLDDDLTEDDEMDTKELQKKHAEEVANLNAEHKTALAKLNEELTKANANGEVVAAVVKSLPDDLKTIFESPDKVVQLINDGKAYHDGLVDELIKSERVAGLIETDKEDEVNAIRKEYAELPNERLKSMLAIAKKRAPGGKGGVAGSDPNTTAAGESTATVDEKDMNSPLSNPLLYKEAAA